MRWDDVDAPALPENFPLPDVTGATRYEGENGVELYLSDLMPHLVRVEARLNNERLAEQPPAPTTRNFITQTKQDDYDALDGAQPIEVRHSLLWNYDFPNLFGQVAPPPPPEDPVPVIAIAIPQTLEMGAPMQIYGAHFAGATYVGIVGGQEASVTFVSDTLIECDWNEAGEGFLEVITPAGTGQSTFQVSITEPAQP